MDGHETVSVVVTTYEKRRFPDLKELLVTLKSQEHKHLEVIIVVERALELAKWLEDYCRLNLQCSWKVLFNEGKPGISGSRNIGIDHAQGEVIAFVDDDVLLPPGWIQAVLSTFEKEDIGAVTGGAEPLWTGEHMNWLPTSLLWLVGSTTWYKKPAGTETRSVWGMNMAFTHNVFSSGIRFPERLGGVFGSRLHGEEQIVCFSIRHNLERRIVYAPSTVVLHKVYPYRYHPYFFLKSSYDMGATRRMLTQLYGSRDVLQLDTSLVAQMVLDGILDSLPLFSHSARLALKRIMMTCAVLLAAMTGYVLSYRPSAT